MIAAAIFGGAVYILYRELSRLDIGAFTAAMRDTAPWRIGCSLLLTALSFAAVSLYDLFAARLVAPKRISARRALFAGVTGNAIANTLGFHAITGSAVRYRIFASVGVTGADVAKIIGVQGASMAAGFVSVTAFSLLLSPTNHGGLGRVAGVALLAAIGGALAWLYAKKRTVSIGRWTLPFPNAASATQQLAIGTVEMSAAIGALYVLLPAALAPNFFDLVLLYMGALLLGIVSGAPGGAGVFEATLLVSFPAETRPAVLAALVLYRLIYNILPFCLSSVALLLFERRQARYQLDRG
jgi:uncharacterized membrane protein YbhN (UPF0104 family)